MMAHYLKGRVHHDMGEVPIALECYQKATEMADTMSMDCDYKTLSSIYGQEAALFHKQHLPHDELKSLLYYERYRWKIRDTLEAIKGYELRTRPYYLMNDTDSVLSIAMRARQLYLAYGNRKYAASVLPTVISILLDRQQYDSVYAYMGEFERWSGRFDKNGELKGKGVYYYEKGRYALAKGEQDSAFLFFKKSLDRGYKEAGYKGFLLLYEKQHKSDSIEKYAQLYVDANDYMHLHTNQSLIHNISSMYNFGRQQSIAKRKSDEAQFNLIWAISVTLVSLFLIYLACLFRWTIKKKKAKIRQLQDFIEFDKTQLGLLNKEVFVLKRTLSQFSEKNEQEDMTDRENNTNEIQLLLEDKERELSLLKNRLHFYQYGISNPEDYYNISQGEICESFRGYLKDVRHHPSESEWKSLYVYVEEKLPSFKPIIFQRGSVSEDQYKICCLVRVGFSPSEIHVITNMSKENVSAIRKRLLKKILGVDGKPKDFDKFIMGIKN
jgi:hypothetical protein